MANVSFLTFLSYNDNRLLLTIAVTRYCCYWAHPRTTDIQWRHKSKKSENLGRCGRQNMLQPYLKIWEWEWIFGRAVKAISLPGFRSPWAHLSSISNQKSNVVATHYISNKLQVASWGSRVELPALLVVLGNNNTNMKKAQNQCCKIT